MLDGAVSTFSEYAEKAILYSLIDQMHSTGVVWDIYSLKEYPPKRDCTGRCPVASSGLNNALTCVSLKYCNVGLH